MRIALLSLLFLALSLLAVSQGIVIPLRTPAPEEVLGFLAGMNLPPAFKSALAEAFTSAFATGRATTTVTLLLLQDLTTIPPDKAERGLEIIRYAISQGFIVDTGLAGSSMINEARKLLALGRAWEEIEYVLGLRLNFLLATRSTLARYGLIQVGKIGPDVPLTPADRFVLEVAWAVGDFVLWEGGDPGDPRILTFVQERLNRLCGVGVLPADVAQLAAALTPEILHEIVRLVFQPMERR